MIHLVFYICALVYYVQLWLVDNFNPIGKEFTSIVILGLIAILTKKWRVK